MCFYYNLSLLFALNVTLFHLADMHAISSIKVILISAVLCRTCLTFAITWRIMLIITIMWRAFLGNHYLFYFWKSHLKRYPDSARALYLPAPQRYNSRP